MKKTPAILLSIAALLYGLIPPIIDFTESHVFHPDWPAHARLHMVWLLAVGFLLGVYVLISLWVKPNIQKSRHASVIGCIVLAGFFTSVLLVDVYGGALSGLEESILVMGMTGNVIAFAIAVLLQIIGTTLLWRTSSSSK